MIHAAVEAAHMEARRQGLRRVPKVLAVTVLTSLDGQALSSQLRVASPVQEHVVHLAKMAKAAGAFGVVASLEEAAAVREACGKDFFVATPGVRPSYGQGHADDQRRIGTPSDAVRRWSSAIIVGRPILEASDPVAMARKIRAELRHANRQVADSHKEIAP